MKGVLFGHSFVSSLKDHMNLGASRQLTPVQIANTLRINDVVESLDLDNIMDKRWDSP